MAWQTGNPKEEGPAWFATDVGGIGLDSELRAVLLTDLSGYTEFSSRAGNAEIEAAVRQQQNIIRPIIEEYRGRLIKWIGDAALAVFGSATSAILCARRIQNSFVEFAERGTGVIDARVKVVVNAGDVMVDKDGDIYGDAVNFTARMEKVAEADEVYFSEAVRRLIPKGEIPYEFVGEFDFKGIDEKARVFRTCFGQTPVIRERVALVQTNFVGVQDVADRLGWDVIHPVLDRTTGAIVESCRKHGGTNRGSGPVGSFLTFPSAIAALDAARGWHARCKLTRLSSIGDYEIKTRAAVHYGTVHLMKYTMMGRDIDVVRTLSALGTGDEILLTGEAADDARSGGLSAGLLVPVGTEQLRTCTSKTRWMSKFAGTRVYSVQLRNRDPSTGA